MDVVSDVAVVAAGRVHRRWWLLLNVAGEPLVDDGGLCFEVEGRPGWPWRAVLVGGSSGDFLVVDALAQQAGDVAVGQAGVLNLPGVGELMDEDLAFEDVPLGGSTLVVGES